MQARDSFKDVGEALLFTYFSAFYGDELSFSTFLKNTDAFEDVPEWHELFNRVHVFLPLSNPDSNERDYLNHIAFIVALRLSNSFVAEHIMLFNRIRLSQEMIELMVVNGQLKALEIALRK